MALESTASAICSMSRFKIFILIQNVNTHTREQAARQRTDTSVEADEDSHQDDTRDASAHTKRFKMLIPTPASHRPASPSLCDDNTLYIIYIARAADDGTASVRRTTPAPPATAADGARG